MRKVYLDNLPRKGKRIDWKNSEGYEVKFIYEDVEGIFIIKGYEYDTKSHGALIMEYNNVEHKITTTCITQGNIGRLIGKYTKEYKIKINDIITDKNRSLKITDRFVKNDVRKPDKKGRIYNANLKFYKYTCNKCGWTEGVIEENSLLKGNGCTCCANQIAILGINTIWDTDRWMCDLGVSEDDAKRYTRGSDKKINVICPNCEKILYKSPCEIIQIKSIACTCGDGFSYPEKFMYSVLKQLDIEFETQYSPKWIKPKKYDFYISSLNMIVETHGKQHYEKGDGIYKNKLKIEQENDRAKRELALKNDIEYYIELDCRESNMDWIKNSILNSELVNLFDLSNVDWLKCEEFTIKSNIIKDVCDCWNNKNQEDTTKDISAICGIHRATVIRYLKIGNKLNWCKYDSKLEMRKSAKNSNHKNKKPINVFKDGLFLKSFQSISEADKQSLIYFGIQLDFRNISAVLNKKTKSYKGYTFKYIEDNNEEIAEM